MANVMLDHARRLLEVLVADRLARFLDTAAGPVEHLAVKGKHEPVAAQRVRWFAESKQP